MTKVHCRYLTKQRYHYGNQNALSPLKQGSQCDVMFVVTRAGAHCSNSVQTTESKSLGLELTGGWAAHPGKAYSHWAEVKWSALVLPVASYGSVLFGHVDPVPLPVSTLERRVGRARKSFFRWKSPRNCLQRFLGKILQ